MPRDLCIKLTGTEWIRPTYIVSLVSDSRCAGCVRELNLYIQEEKSAPVLKEMSNSSGSVSLLET